MRRSLIVVAVAVTSMVAIAFLVPLAILTRDLAADRELASAERDAESVARLIVVVAESSGSIDIDQVLPSVSATDRPLTVVAPDGTVVGPPLDQGEDISPAEEGASFRQPVEGGEAVYVPVVTSDGTFVVRSVATDEAMTEGVVRTWIILVVVGVVLVMIAVLVADRLGRSVVTPVEELSEAAERLGAGDLDARVEPSGPDEIEAVGRAFNRLAIQVEELLRSEREEVADLAHRLRTPLTGARLTAESLPTDERREVILGQLDELHRVVDHVIAEARRVDRASMMTRSDLAQITGYRITYWEPLASDEERDVTVDIAVRPAPVGVARNDLTAAVDALIGNVFAHTERGVGLTVAVRESPGGGVEFVVEDRGDGFPSDIDVTARGESGARSSGLGLDIARRTVESAGGSMVVGTSPSGGASVVLRFPPLAASIV